MANSPDPLDRLTPDQAEAFTLRYLKEHAESMRALGKSS